MSEMHVNRQQLYCAVEDIIFQHVFLNFDNTILQQIF